MKRKLVVFLVLITIVGWVGVQSFFSKSPQKVFPTEVQPTPLAEPVVLGKESRSIFIPYWGVGNSPFSDEYDQYYYFGILGDKDGINTSDPGYMNLFQFKKNVPYGKKAYVVVRMVDSSVNSAVLRDPPSQLVIIQDSISIANRYDFDGVILDFEINALAFESVTKEINNFVSLFNKSVKENKKEFLITMYGDTFYRLRPYDLKTLSANADEILIMTYDFHKARGNPGPNFPLSGRDTYGYDLKKMISDFQEDLPADKTTVILGLFGYDWEVDSKNNSVGNAEPLSLNQINSRFLQGCRYKNCKIQRDSLSSETKITYTDENGKNHVVWFEDEKSMEEKRKYLESQGINSISLWAYSYF